MTDSLHDKLWSEAIREAYALAPPDQVVLSTLELRHSSFVENGEATAVRLALGDGQLLSGEGDDAVYGYNLTLEATAPVNAGLTVPFVSCPFRFNLPFQREGELPTVDIAIDNISHIIGKYLDAAVTLRERVEVTYREFLLPYSEAPQFVLPGLKVSRVKATQTEVTMTASFDDLVNRNFPGLLYRPSEYRSLSL